MPHAYDCHSSLDPWLHPPFLFQACVYVVISAFVRLSVCVCYDPEHMYTWEGYGNYLEHVYTWEGIW